MMVISETKTMVEDIKKLQSFPKDVFEREGFAKSKQVQIIDIEYPTEGGMLLHIHGEKHPFKGYPHPAIVYSLDCAKAILMQALKLATSFPYILFFWKIPSVIKQAVDKAASHAVRFYIKESYFNTSARELLRLFKPISDSGNYQEFLKMMLMIWEFDSAYRWRGQDILAELDKRSLRMRPKMELSRLLKIGYERENEPTVKDKWRLAKLLTWLAPRKYVKILQGALLEADLDKLVFDKVDLYSCLYRKPYDFAGLSYEDRVAKHEEMFYATQI